MDDERRRIAKARAGDRPALDELWREHCGWVAAVLVAHLSPTAEIEDLLQEVALVFIERLDDVREPAALRGWLRQVAVNVARQRSRREGRSEAVDGAETLTDPGYERELDQARWEQRLRSVLSAAHELPLEYREPLLLKAVGGLSQLRIAEILGVPETTVETRLARARRMLREKLAAKDSGRGWPPSDHPSPIRSREVPR